MSNTIQKIENVQLVAGYVASGTLLTIPKWIEILTPYMQFGALIIGITVGVTTVYLNIVSIISKKATKEKR